MVKKMLDRVPVCNKDGAILGFRKENTHIMSMDRGSGKTKTIIGHLEGQIEINFSKIVVLNPMRNQELSSYCKKHNIYCESGKYQTALFWQRFQITEERFQPYNYLYIDEWFELDEEFRKNILIECKFRKIILNAYGTINTEPLYRSKIKHARKYIPKLNF